MASLPRSELRSFKSAKRRMVTWQELKDCKDATQWRDLWRLGDMGREYFRRREKRRLRIKGRKKVLMPMSSAVLPALLIIWRSVLTPIMKRNSITP